MIDVYKTWIGDFGAITIPPRGSTVRFVWDQVSHIVTHELSN
jgi:hypothetical protein